MFKYNRYVDDVVHIYNWNPSMQGSTATSAQDMMELATEKIVISRKITQVDSIFRLT